MHDVHSRHSLEDCTMKPLMRTVFTTVSAVAFLSVLSTQATAGEPEPPIDAAAFIGQPVALIVEPETIRLAGPRSIPLREMSQSRRASTEITLIMTAII